MDLFGNPYCQQFVTIHSFNPLFKQSPRLMIMNLYILETQQQVKHFFTKFLKYPFQDFYFLLIYLLFYLQLNPLSRPFLGGQASSHPPQFVSPNSLVRQPRPCHHWHQEQAYYFCLPKKCSSIFLFQYTFLVLFALIRCA